MSRCSLLIKFCSNTESTSPPLILRISLSFQTSVKSDPSICWLFTYSSKREEFTSTKKTSFFTNSSKDINLWFKLKTKFSSGFSSEFSCLPTQKTLFKTASSINLKRQTKKTESLIFKDIQLLSLITALAVQIKEKKVTSISPKPCYSSYFKETKTSFMLEKYILVS